LNLGRSPKDIVFKIASSKGKFSCKRSKETISQSQGDWTYVSRDLLNGAGAEDEANAETIST